MTDDAATVREALIEFHADLRYAGKWFGRREDALAANARLAAQAARADRYEEALDWIYATPEDPLWVQDIAREALDAETPDA